MAADGVMPACGLEGGATDLTYLARISDLLARVPGLSVTRVNGAFARRIDPS